MDVQKYGFLAAVSLISAVVGFFVLGQIYGVYLDLLEFGPSLFFAPVWSIMSLLFLGCVAGFTGNKSLVWYHLEGKKVEWEKYETDPIIWFPWLSFKVIVLGFILKNTIFGMGLYSFLLLGFVPEWELALVVFGPVLDALLFRFIIDLISNLSLVQTERLGRLYVLAPICLILALLTIKAFSPLVMIKIGLFLAFALGCIILTKLKRTQQSLVYFTLLIGVWIVPIFADLVLGVPAYDNTLYLAGLDNIKVHEISLMKPNATIHPEIIGLSSKVRQWSPEEAYNKIIASVTESHERFDDVEVWFNDQPYLIAPELLVADKPVNTNWKSKHIEYTHSEGISIMDPRSGKLINTQTQFPNRKLFYGPNNGYINWVFAPTSERGGLEMKSPLVFLFDSSVADYLPGKLMRYREISTRIKRLFPYVETGEAYLVTDGIETYYASTLIVNLPATWVPDKKVEFAWDVGLVLINVETGEISLYRTTNNQLSQMLGLSYNFQEPPTWLRKQLKYSKQFMIKQLDAINVHLSTRLALPNSLKQDYVLLEEGPALIFPTKIMGAEKISGYLYFGCGDDYGSKRLYKFDEPIMDPLTIPQLLESSSTLIPERGIELSKFMRTGNSKMGSPTLYLFKDNAYYFVPIYISGSGTTKVLKYVVVINGKNAKMGIGTDSQRAMTNYFS